MNCSGHFSDVNVSMNMMSLKFTLEVNVVFNNLFKKCFIVSFLYLFFIDLAQASGGGM